MSERKRIYLCLAHMSDEGMEQKYVKEAFDTNWVVPLGPNVNAFEADLDILRLLCLWRCMVCRIRLTASWRLRTSMGSPWRRSI